MNKELRIKVQRRKGFTLIEVLVTATIIAVLTMIGVVSFTTTNQRARNGKRRADIEQVRAALELYHSDTLASSGLYPTTGFSQTTTTLVSKSYLSQPTPQDPKNVSPYVYSYSSTDGSSYCLCADLEGSAQGNSPDNSCGNIGATGAGTYYCLVNP